MKAMGDQREEAPFVRLVHLLEVLLTADGPQSIADLNCALQERFGLVDSTANQIRRALKRLETFGYQLARTTKRSPAGGTCLAIALDPLPRGRRPADPGAAVTLHAEVTALTDRLAAAEDRWLTLTEELAG